MLVFKNVKDKKQVDSDISGYSWLDNRTSD